MRSPPAARPISRSGERRGEFRRIAEMVQWVQGQQRGDCRGNDGVVRTTTAVCARAAPTSPRRGWWHEINATTPLGGAAGGWVDSPPMAKRKGKPAGLDAELAARSRRLSARVLRILRDVEAIRSSRLRLSCDRWGHGRVIGDLTWAAENLHVISEHLCGRAMGDDMGYWVSHEIGQSWTGVTRSRVLHAEETVVAANQAEFDGVRKTARRRKRAGATE